MPESLTAPAIMYAPMISHMVEEPYQALNTRSGVATWNISSSIRYRPPTKPDWATPVAQKTTVIRLNARHFCPSGLSPSKGNSKIITAMIMPAISPISLLFISTPLYIPGPA